MGQEIVNHAVLKDFAVVQAGAMVIGATYLTATVLADIAYSLLNPRIRFGTPNERGRRHPALGGRNPDGGSGAQLAPRDVHAAPALADVPDRQRS